MSNVYKLQLLTIYNSIMQEYGVYILFEKGLYCVGTGDAWDIADDALECVLAKCEEFLGLIYGDINNSTDLQILDPILFSMIDQVLEIKNLIKLNAN